MYYGENEGWGKPRTGSLLAHAIVFALFGVAIHFAPTPEHVSLDPVVVEIYDPGGGGGGGSDIAAQNASIFPDDSDAYSDWESTEESIDENVEAPIHDAYASTPEQSPAKPVRKHRVRRSRSGSGTGQGTGHGSGIGSGTGSGIGSGRGSGIGSGTGSGTGSGVGSNTAPPTSPSILSAPDPKYPESARRANIEGTVGVELVIGAQGSVTSAWVAESSGNAALDQAAVDAVYRWRFAPGTLNGSPVETRSRVRVNFDLRQYSR